MASEPICKVGNDSTDMGGNNMATLKSKHTSYGLVEVRDSSISGWFALYINGEMKEQSADLGYIMRQYDKY
jgi:hypothetical protein